MQKLGDLVTKIRNWFKKEEVVDESGDDGQEDDTYVVSSPTAWTTPIPSSGWITSPTFTGAASTINMTIPSTTYTSGNWSVAQGVVGGGNFTINHQPSTNAIAFYGGNNTEIVRLNRDGTVVWANGIDLDAAEAFTRAFTLGAELSAGITDGVKSRMRDSVFEDLIAVAKEKGSLSVDELTFLYEGTKIMEKLRGSKK